MQQFFFSDGLAAEVKRRVDEFKTQQAQVNAWLEGVMVATAQANGAGPNDQVRLNAEGTGVVVDGMVGNVYGHSDLAIDSMPRARNTDDTDTTETAD